MKNSRTKRKLKLGFKGIGSHKMFGVGKHPDEITEKLLGNYNTRFNRTCHANEAYANLVHAAIKHAITFKIDDTGNIIETNKSCKHIGSKPLRIIKERANFK